MPVRDLKSVRSLGLLIALVASIVLGRANASLRAWESVVPFRDPEQPLIIQKLAISNRGIRWFLLLNSVAYTRPETWNWVVAGPPKAAALVLSDLVVTADGSAWVSTRLNGVRRLLNGTWIVYGTANGSLPSDDVQQMRLRNEHELWVALAHGTIAILRDDSSAIHFLHLNTAHLRNWSGQITSLDFEAQDAWVGLDDDGIARFRAGAWKYYSVEDHNLGFDRSERLVRLGDHNLWLVHSRGGVSHLEGDTWHRYSVETGGLRSNFVSYVCGNASRAWVTTQGGGISEFTSSGFVVHGADDGILPSDNVDLATCDSHGRLWVHTTDGRVTRVDDQSSHTFPETFPPANAIVALHDNIWLATISGLFRNVNEEWVRAGPPAMATSDIWYAGQGAPNELWVSSVPGGIFRLQTNTASLHLSTTTVSVSATLRLQALPGDSVRPWSLYYGFANSAKIPDTSERTSIAPGEPAVIPLPEHSGHINTFFNAVAVSDDGTTASLQADERPVLLDVTSRSSAMVRFGISASEWLTALYALVWVPLFVLYPVSARVRYLVFWNPAVRKPAGLLLVDLVLLFAPSVARYLLLPFKSELLGPALLSQGDRYFKGMRGWVDDPRAGGPETELLIDDALAKARRPTLLIGASGAGKTRCVQAHALRASPLCVYLRASECGNGVIEAIAIRLPSGPTAAYILRRCISSGLLPVVIDGVNEVEPDVRAAIGTFVRENARGRLIIASQPTGWRPAVSVAVIRMQPLALQEVRQFINEKYPEEDAMITERLQQMVETADSQADARIRLLHVRALTTPYDLETVILLLREGREPSLLSLERQHFALVGHLFMRMFGAPLPLRELTELAYTCRVAEQPTFDASKYELTARSFLCDQRVWSRSPIFASHYQFRHDLVQDYLVAQMLLLSPELLTKYVADSRFTGAYVAIADELDGERARTLLATISAAGARSSVHSVADAFALRLEELGKIA